MKNILYVIILFLILHPFNGEAQFILNNDATIVLPECSALVTTYQLTPNANNQGGQIWYTTQANLTQRFDIQFEMFLGTKSYGVGADGICFVFQQQNSNAGSVGGGLGYQGITPSLAVEFDTYPNAWDPAFCHTAIEKNGDVDHTDLSGNNLAGPVQLDPSNPNLPDGNWHNMEIIWNPVYDSLSVYYDCIFRIGYQGNAVDSIFGGNPNVYWGFTAGTGGSDNKQEVCITHSYLNNLRDTSVCSSDSVTLSASGGVSYTWGPNIGLNRDTGSTIHAAPNITTTYTVSIKNNCGLISKDSVTVTVYPSPNITTTWTNLLCNGATNGTASVIATSGTSPYYYLWTPSGQTNATATGLSAGIYTITVTDQNGCIGTAGTATVTITQPTALNPIAGFTQASCDLSNGSVNVSATGGTSPYTYLWNSLGNTNTVVTGLSAGTYSVTIHDSNGCSATTLVTITQPSAVIPSLGTIVSPPCNGQAGSATVNVSGGTSPYTYAWTTGGTNATGTGLTVGTYTVSVTDNNGCTSSLSVTITQPSVVSALMGTPISPLCNGEPGSATVMAGGGTSPYQYIWPSGGTNATDSNLLAGTYTVTVKDANGCPATASVTITQPSELIATIGNTTNSTCNQKNGAASVTVGGGTPNYSYSWIPTGQTSATATGLSAGKYTVRVKDANGCTTTSGTIISTDTASINACCNTTILQGRDTTIMASGDSSIISYSWSPSVHCLNPPLCNSVSVSPTVTTTYTVIGKDSIGCESERVITITVETPCFNIAVPNVFTPASSGTLGLDNVFYIQTIDIQAWSIIIYDRWGKELFNSTNPTSYWTGTTESGGQAPAGIYYYLINATCQGNSYKKQGFVQLIR